MWTVFLQSFLLERALQTFSIRIRFGLLRNIINLRYLLWMLLFIHKKCFAIKTKRSFLETYETAIKRLLTLPALRRSYTTMLCARDYKDVFKKGFTLSSANFSTRQLGTWEDFVGFNGVNKKKIENFCLRQLQQHLIYIQSFHNLSMM